MLGLAVRVIVIKVAVMFIVRVGLSVMVMIVKVGVRDS